VYVMLEAGEHAPWTLYQQGRYAEAVEVLDAELAAHPSEPGLLLLRAQCHQALGQLDLTLEDYTSVLTVDDSAARTWSARAACRLQMGDAEAALSDVHAALRRSSVQAEQLGSLHALASTCFTYLGRLHEAVEAATSALACSPSERTYRVGRAAAWSRLARCSAGPLSQQAAQAALRDYDLAASIEPLSEAERLDGAVLALHVRSFAQARETLESLRASASPELAEQVSLLLAEAARLEEQSEGGGDAPSDEPLSVPLLRWLVRQGCPVEPAQALNPVGAYAFHHLADWEFSPTQGLRFVAVPEVGGVLLVFRDDEQPPFAPLLLLPAEAEHLVATLLQISERVEGLGEGEALRVPLFAPRRVVVVVEGVKSQGKGQMALLAISRAWAPDGPSGKPDLAPGVEAQAPASSAASDPDTGPEGSSKGVARGVGLACHGAAVRLGWPVARTAEAFEVLEVVRAHAQLGKPPVQGSFSAWRDGVLEVYHNGQPASYALGGSFATDLTDLSGELLAPFELVLGEPLAIYAVPDSATALPLAVRAVRLTPPHLPSLAPEQRLLRDATSPLERFAELCEMGERADDAVRHARWDEAIAVYEALRVALASEAAEPAGVDLHGTEPAVIEPFLAAKLTLGTLWLAVQQDDLQGASNLLGATWGVYGAGIKSLREGRLSPTDTTLFLLLCARLCALHRPAGEMASVLNQTLEVACSNTTERTLLAIVLSNWMAHLREMAGTQLPQEWLDAWLAARDAAGLDSTLDQVVDQVRFFAPDRWIKRLQTM
jgi:tetratricopeptide (TPR) repeat protein